MREIHYNLLQYFPILKGKALCPGSFLPSLLPPGLQHIGITWRALNTINAWVPRSRDYKSWDVTWALGCWTAPWATLMWSQGKKRCSRSRAAGVILLANYLWVPSPVSEGQADADLRRPGRQLAALGDQRAGGSVPVPQAQSSSVPGQFRDSKLTAKMSEVLIRNMRTCQIHLNLAEQSSIDQEKFGWAELDRPRGVKPKSTYGLTIRAASLKLECLRLRMTWRAHGQRPLGPDPRLSSLVCQGGAKDGKPDVAAAGQGTTVWEPLYWGVWP